MVNYQKHRFLFNSKSSLSLLNDFCLWTEAWIEDEVQVSGKTGDMVTYFDGRLCCEARHICPFQKDRSNNFRTNALINLKFNIPLRIRSKAGCTFYLLPENIIMWEKQSKYQFHKNNQLVATQGSWNMLNIDYGFRSCICWKHMLDGIMQ